MLKCGFPVLVAVTTLASAAMALAQSGEPFRKGAPPVQTRAPFDASSPLLAVAPAPRDIPPASAPPAPLPGAGPLQSASPLQAARPTALAGPLDATTPLQSATSAPGGPTPPGIVAGTGPFQPADPLQSAIPPDTLAALAPGGAPLLPRRPAAADELAAMPPPADPPAVPVTLDGLLAHALSLPGGAGPLLLATLVDVVTSRPDAAATASLPALPPRPPVTRIVNPPLPPAIGLPPQPPPVFTPPPQRTASVN